MTEHKPNTKRSASSAIQDLAHCPTCEAILVRRRVPSISATLTGKFVPDNHTHRKCGIRSPCSSTLTPPNSLIKLLYERLRFRIATGNHQHLPETICASDAPARCGRPWRRASRRSTSRSLCQAHDSANMRDGSKRTIDPLHGKPRPSGRGRLARTRRRPHARNASFRLLPVVADFRLTAQRSFSRRSCLPGVSVVPAAERDIVPHLQVLDTHHRVVPRRDYLHKTTTTISQNRNGVVGASCSGPAFGVDLLTGVLA